ncbi:uncharacterized protein N0V89_008367 [Didymosphaeria variabile]|uniref:Rab-GAP TBC domain-containing protein n=1 Tax=Didymosphaeria variabile TaxID=1932322 RepID=A0A9W8XFM1_9PLEO|nr:uncharacterized protein N0V89_008367 [Didymosphaeria variabile]KAJ4349749.1 hypothetical protein N0V89_008367 [Didymosphaeria variabile]
MSEPPPPTSPRAWAPIAADSGTRSETPVSRQHYLPYRPHHAEYTPPTSPQPSNNPHAQAAPRKGFGSGRSRQPAQLQMDVAVAPAYERAVYSPSPTASPPLLPLTSPKFSTRSRTPSLLRHAALSSPLNNGFPRAEQPQSPTFPPVMRQINHQSVTSDPRSLFNPLASNPVNPNGSDPFADEVPWPQAQQQRHRGMTTSTQASFQGYPPLRSATSIPDYGPIRASNRSNPSGAYKPDRGGLNWSHNEHFPPRLLRGEESRASVRSGLTNASSLMEQSGTERSSVATGRSSIVSSDNRASTYSRDQSEERDLSTDTLPTSISPDEEDIMSSVEDVIDAYFDEPEDQESEPLPGDTVRYRGSSALDSDAGHNDRSSSYSQDISRPTSSYIPAHEQLGQAANTHNRELSRVSERDSFGSSPNRLSMPQPAHLDLGSLQASTTTSPQENQRAQKEQLTTHGPLRLDHTTNAGGDQQLQTIDMALQRSSEELPRRTSTMAAERRSRILVRPRLSTKLSSDSHKMQEIHKELTGLPQIPRSKSRLSRHDWAEFEGYAKRHSKGPSAALRALTEASTTSPPKRSSPLPEVDEDDAFPRRASTSIFDRKSTLFDLSSFEPSPPSKAMTTNFGSNKPHARPSAGLKKSAAVGVERDRYGFKKASDKISVQEYNTWHPKYEEYVTRRSNKWITLMRKSGLSVTKPTEFPEACDKVKRYARKGYPPDWRGEMWWFYSGAQFKSRQMSGLYRSLVARVENGELNKDDREAIERDLDRTFPDNIHFRPDLKSARFSDGGDDEPSMVRDLREVLSAFALHNPGIGYCQSLNFIAGLLLLFLKQDTERAFILLTIITQNHLPGAHARNLANTEVNVLMMLIRDYLPKVWASINDTDLVNSGPGSKAHPESKFQRQPTVALSCTSWFMSVFIGVLPIETVLRVWDAFLYEGPRALYRYALAIFKLGEGEIRKYRPGDGELFMAVQNLPRRCLDPNTLHDIAFVKKGFGSLTQNVIDQKRQFWRDQNERSASQRKRAPPQPVRPDTAVGDDEGKKGLGGLRRRASMRFLRKREKTYLE